MASRHMSRAASTVGMMDGAFFVSRSDLLQWVNDLLRVNLTKVEQCANGSIYCQIIDCCHPGSVAMRKLNWMAKSDHEYIPNYKVLQAAFDRRGVEKHIDVDKLIRGKYQDNLEFLQWMKCYWEREGMGRRDYDPVAARADRPLPPWAKALGNFPVAAAGKPRVERGEKENLRPQSAAKGVEALGRKMAAAPEAGLKTTRPAEEGRHSGEGHDKERQAFGELKGICSKQKQELDELRDMLDGLERERDYYFRKLRDVEVLCGTLQSKMDTDMTAERLIEDIQGILYAGGDDEDDAMPAEA